MTQEKPYRTPDLSVVIPAHNEAGRILAYLQSIRQHLSGRGQPYEIIVVDDGSQDDTIPVVRSFGKTEPALRLIPLPTCVGKGGAVRQGMLAARGPLQLFADADGATPIGELDHLERAIQNGADLAIGSRCLAAPHPDFTVSASWHRNLLINCFNAIIRIGGIRGIADTQCGFKLFQRAVARDLFSVSAINGYGIDMELLYIAQQRGYRVAEVPVKWSDQPGSHVRLFRDGVGLFRELALIHRNAANGYYSHLLPPSSSSALTSTSPILE